MTSPGGYQYPRPLSWDMSAADLELALEWTYDIGEVSVVYTEHSNSTRSYQVTFDVRRIYVKSSNERRYSYQSYLNVE